MKRCLPEASQRCCGILFFLDNTQFGVWERYRIMKRLLPRCFKALARDARDFRWWQALPRMTADVLLVNGSMFLAFAAWMLFKTKMLSHADSTELLRNLITSFRGFCLFWTLAALLIFDVSGFYTRSRGYATRFKAWVIFRAVSILVIVLVLADYYLFFYRFVPRSIWLLGGFFMLLSVGGARLANLLFRRQYRIEPKRQAAKLDQVLVVGGAGYLGSTLVPMLLTRGYRVRVLDSLLFGSQSLHGLEGRNDFELMQADVRDIQAVVEAMRGCQAVIHLAAIVGDPACEEDRVLAIETNRAATRMLIDVARGYGVRRFLFASTCSVYGASDYIVDEHSAVAPISTYGNTKVDSEMLLLDEQGSEFAPTILRLGTLFGLSPRPRFDLVVNLLTARAVTNRKITIFNGEQWRPFVHVSDAARAFIACLEARPEVVGGEVFNVGSDNLNKRLAEVSDQIAAAIPDLEVEHIQNSDRRNYRVSFAKIRTRLGFHCEKRLEQGIMEIYEAIRSRRINDYTAPRFNNQAITRAFAQTPGARRSTLRMLNLLAAEDGYPVRATVETGDGRENGNGNGKAPPIHMLLPVREKGQITGA
jgi:nucleoside-diphosphate-sugar epimerase